jgi:hypothetical protein
MSGDAGGGVVTLSSYVDAVTGQHFWAGISMISDDGHEIVRRNPKKWGSKARTVDTAGYHAHEAKKEKRAPRRTSARPLAAVERTRSAKSTTTPKRSPSWMLPLSVSRAEDEKEIPGLRLDKPSTREFVFATSHSLDPIRAELTEYRDMLENGGETGGWLFCTRHSFTRYALHPTRLGDDGERNRHEVLLGLDEGFEAARRAAVAGVKDHFFCGAWHVQPYPGATKPSGQDRWASLSRLDRAEFGATTPFAVDVIVTPDRDRGYSRPHFHAWVTDRSGFNGRAITVPGTLAETNPQW